MMRPSRYSLTRRAPQALLLAALGAARGQDEEQLLHRKNATPPAYLRWDPPPLAPFFWRPSGCGSKDGPLYEAHCNGGAFATVDAWCATSVEAITLSGTYGRENNALVEWRHLVQYAVSVEPPITIASAPGDAVARYIGRNNYDFAGATATWACATADADAWRREKPRRSVKTVSAREVYYLSQSDVAHYVGAHVLAQLLLRPSSEIRARVEEFERALPGNERGYVAIHLRNLEGSCQRRVKQNQEWRRQRLRVDDIVSAAASASNASFANANKRGRQRTDDELGDFFAPHLCHMSDEYIRAALRASGCCEGYPLVLAHDGQLKQRAQEIQERLGAVSYVGDLGAQVDMQLLLRAQYFIGLPASSFSRNMLDIRCVNAATHYEARSNMHCGWDSEIPHDKQAAKEEREASLTEELRG